LGIHLTFWGFIPYFEWLNPTGDGPHEAPHEAITQPSCFVRGRWRWNGVLAVQLRRLGEDHKTDQKWFVCIPGTQMTLVLLEKGRVLEGSTPKIEDKSIFLQ